MRYDEVDIGPDYAKELLAANDKNRTLPRNNLARYTRDMKDGNWHFIGDPIRIGTTGRLIDGQTRLESVIASDTVQRFAVYFDFPEDLQPYVDTGRSRTPGDVFKMNAISRPGTAASISRLIQLYKQGAILDNVRQIPAEELLAFYNAYPERIFEAAKRGEELRNIIQLNPSVVGVTYFLAREVADLFEVNWFFERVADGFMLTPGNPIAALRSYVIRRIRDRDLRTSRSEYLWHLMQTWNNWARGESVTRLQQPKGGLNRSDQFPKLITPLPGVIPEAARNEYYQPKKDNAVIKEGPSRS